VQARRNRPLIGKLIETPIRFVAVDLSIAIFLVLEEARLGLS
jgi:hypothetical protein